MPPPFAVKVIKSDLPYVDICGVLNELADILLHLCGDDLNHFLSALHFVPLAHNSPDLCFDRLLVLVHVNF